MSKIADPNPDEMMQLLRQIKNEVDIHGKLVVTKAKLNNFIDQYTGDPDPDCPHDEVVVIAKYKWGKKLKDDDRVRTASYCGVCKIRLID